MTYPLEQIEFLQAVNNMREAQRDYFAQPGQYRLKISLAAEGKVDNLLKPYIDAGIIKTKAKPLDNQATLFS